MTYFLKDQKIEAKQDKRFKWVRIKVYLNGKLMDTATYSKHKNPKKAIKEEIVYFKEDVRFTIQKIREKYNITYLFTKKWHWKPLICKIAQNLKERE